jgi:hypothetical protein
VGARGPRAAHQQLHEQRQHRRTGLHGRKRHPQLDLQQGHDRREAEFASNFDKAVSYDCTGGKYPYIAYPASFGRPSAVTVGGLAFSDFIVATQDFTNASGFVSSYLVIRLFNLQTGAKISTVWA